MRTSKFPPELKEKVLQALQAGTPIKDIAADTEVPATTIGNWKKELNEGGKTRKRKANGASVEQRLTDMEWSLSLERLENKALRKMINDPDPAHWPAIEIIYLRERLGLLGDTAVIPLGQLLEESAQGSDAEEED